MGDSLRVTLEEGKNGKRVVAVAPDWPGLSRGAKTEEAALERLRSYLPRYAPVATGAGLMDEFTLEPDLEIVERYEGTGSTDFWGISFASSAIDRQDMTEAELDRELALLRACWSFFDDVRGRVTPVLRKGPRGGGWDRDKLVWHTVANELEWGKNLGLPGITDSMPDDTYLQDHRAAYAGAIRAYHAEDKMARKWTLRYLIRHTAFHTMDHAWQMEDTDLSGEAA